MNPRYMESLAEVLHRSETGGPKARPSIYKDIRFRSRLEARFAKHLDATGEQWSYEPRNFGGQGGYLPDFEILGATRPTYIELKPTRREVPAAQAKMSIIWKTVPDALLIVACEEGSTFYSAFHGGRWNVWQERWT